MIAPANLPKEPRVPELDLPCAVDIPSSEFLRTTKAADKIGDGMRFTMEEDQILLTTKSDSQSVESKLPMSELSGIKHGFGSAIYSMSYLRSMAKSGSKAQAVKMEWGQDYPLRMSFGIGENGIAVQYLLAPRIETE